MSLASVGQSCVVIWPHQSGRFRKGIVLGVVVEYVNDLRTIKVTGSVEHIVTDGTCWHSVGNIDNDFLNHT